MTWKQVTKVTSNIINETSSQIWWYTQVRSALRRINNSKPAWDTWCLSLVSTAVINIMTKSNLGRKGFISFYTSTPQSTIEGQDRNSRKEPGGRNWSRDHGGVAAYWLVWLVFFTIQDHLAQWTGISQFSYLSGNCLEMHPQDNLMEFFNRDSLFPGVHSPCQISRN